MSKRSDANQPEIMAALRQVGAVVLDLHEVGHGCPDLLVSCNNSGATFLLEIKMPGKKQNLLEMLFARAWKGAIYVAHDIDEAIKAYQMEDISRWK